MCAEFFYELQTVCARYRACTSPYRICDRKHPYANRALSCKGLGVSPPPPRMAGGISGRFFPGPRQVGFSPKKRPIYTELDHSLLYRVKPVTAQVKAGEPRRLTEGYLANVDGSGSKLANVWVGVAGEQINKQKLSPPHRGVLTWHHI